MLKKLLLWLAFIVVLLIIGMLALYCEKKSNPSELTGDPEQVKAENIDPSIPRVGIQIGHWKTDELPNELWKLRWNFGSESGRYTELDSNTTIANLVVSYLEDEGIEVDLLPATIPEGYQADAFLSIHADGNDDTTVSGYKITWSEFDTSGKSEALSNAIEELYAEATKLDSDPNISSSMTQYFAFNYVKYAHAISSKTPAAIIETGFITNANDRKIIVNQPEAGAKAIAEGIISYLKTQDFSGWPK